MSAYLILGAGKFGRLALTRLVRQDAAARFTVVERVPRVLAAARQAWGEDGVNWVESEAIAFLVANLREQSSWDWLIPVVPEHVAFAWLWQAHLAARGWRTLPVPEEVGSHLPLVRRGRQGELYLSRADFLCPDDCLEPEVCPVDGQSREVPLYEELARLPLAGFAWRVVPSRQLAPGVGGYPPGALLALAPDLAASEGKVLLATACRCHGVVHALKTPGGGR
jgi:hypothetical protein